MNPSPIIKYQIKKIDKTIIYLVLLLMLYFGLIYVLYLVMR